MVTSVLWNALRTRLGTPRQERGSVSLQHLGLSDRDIGDLRPVLDKVGDELAVNLELHGHAGDIVLLDVPFASRLSPQLVHAFTEGRPVVLLGDGQTEAGPLLSTAQRLERRQQALLRQLREIALVRARSAKADSGQWAPTSAPASQSSSMDRSTSGFDAGFDSRIDGDQLMAASLEHGQREVLQHVVRALFQPGAKPYAASYGAEANLLFDFKARLVFIDPQAQQQLRVKRELPQPAPGAKPQTDALVRELDETLWDLGVAAGPFPLLDEPANWWRCPLRLVEGAQMERYSRIPRNLDLARRLAQGPAAASELRRHANVSVSDLRRFIQAGLMLRLLDWAPGALATSAMSTLQNTPSNTPSNTPPNTTPDTTPRGAH
jgi:hypothetical protein